MTIEEIKEKIIPIAEEYGVPKVALFGSTANGTNTDTSDIDILIERGTKMKGFAFGGFCNKLEEALGKEIDVLTYFGIRNSILKESILAKEVVIYEKR